jgi:hypothetical protein
MPLSKLTELDLREACRARLEMLELWLRRLIHEQFEQIYSSDILNAKNAAGDFVVTKQIRANIEKTLSDRPGRYNRPVDAAHLDDLITIICKPDTYRSCFETPLKGRGGGGVGGLLQRLTLSQRAFAVCSPTCRTSCPRLKRTGMSCAKAATNGAAGPSVL